MGGDELLLLADCTQEPKRMHPKADHCDNGQRQDRSTGAERHTHTFPRIWRGEDQEGERQSRGQLDAHARHQRTGAGAWM